MKTKFVIIFVTCSSSAEARKIADALIAKRLVACANIVPGVESKFRWKGKVDTAKEALIMLKTKAAYFSKVEKAVRRMHSYDVPEIIAVPIIAGNREYLSWIGDSVKRKAKSEKLKRKV